MRKRLALAAFAMACAVAACAPTGPPPQGPPADAQVAQADRFPTSQGHEIADRACVTCHSPSLVTQQAKDSTAWEKTLGTMMKWGAQIDTTERESLRVYLVREFGPHS